MTERTHVAELLSVSCYGSVMCTVPYQLPGILICPTVVTMAITEAVRNRKVTGCVYRLDACNHYPPFDRFAESMKSFSASLETEDTRLKSLALEHYGSFLYLVGDMDGSLEHFRCAGFCFVFCYMTPLPAVAGIDSGRRFDVATNLSWLYSLDIWRQL